MQIFIVLVNDFRFYTNCSRKLLMLIAGKLMGGFLLLSQYLTVSFIVSMISVLPLIDSIFRNKIIFPRTVYMPLYIKSIEFF